MGSHGVRFNRENVCFCVLQIGKQREKRTASDTALWSRPMEVFFGNTAAAEALRFWRTVIMRVAVAYSLIKTNTGDMVNNEKGCDFFRGTHLVCSLYSLWTT